MEFLTEYGLFLAKTVTLVVAVLFVVGSVAALAQRQKKSADGAVEIKHLNDQLKHYRQVLEAHLLEPEQLRKHEKAERKAEKARRKARAVGHEGDDAGPGRVFVLDFHGDLKASEVGSLREAVSAVLTVATAQDEIVVRLESPGGMVHGYGLAASQLARVRQRGLPLTVCVDKVAASGGYLMACIANKIVAAPFAVVGSIGVVAQLPNFNRLLKKHDIDFELFTAGEYKRTVTIFGENTEKGREKFQEDLEQTHRLFKLWVAEYRPQLDIETVANGEVWYGRQALALQLVDELGTSDDYLQERARLREVYHVRHVEKRKLADRLGIGMASLLESALLRWQQSFRSK